MTKTKKSGSDVIKSFSEDFIAHLNSENVLSKVLYGQIHIEYVLNSLLEAGTPFPSKLALDKMTFYSKTKLCVGLGLIHFDMERSIKKLGDIRNRMAHNIDADLSPKEELDFINVLKQSRLGAKIKKSKKDWSSSFSCSVYNLWFYLFEQLVKVIVERGKLEAIRLRIVDTPAEQNEIQAPKSFGIAINK